MFQICSRSCELIASFELDEAHTGIHLNINEYILATSETPRGLEDLPYRPEVCKENHLKPVKPSQDILREVGTLTDDTKMNLYGTGMNTTGTGPLLRTDHVTADRWSKICSRFVDTHFSH